MKFGVYRHYKNILVEAITTATHSETLESLVVYRHLENGKIWARPEVMWDEEVTNADGNKVKRFEYIGEMKAPSPAYARTEDGTLRFAFRCPECRRYIRKSDILCPGCGQPIDWTSESE